MRHLTLLIRRREKCVCVFSVAVSWYMMNIVLRHKGTGTLPESGYFKLPTQKRFETFVKCFTDVFLTVHGRLTYVEAVYCGTKICG